MIPGELYILEGSIELNINRKTMTLSVVNCGDRPIQVGSHFHFYETNRALQFNRVVTKGFRLDIPSGTTIRFEPGQLRNVQLVNYVGKCLVYGFRKLIMGYTGSEL